jgi:glutaredoxin-like YruB-family protein
METIPLSSYNELASEISTGEKAYLLLYKSGSSKSDCALERLQKIDREDSGKIFIADVSTVRDIHQRLEITSAPSLVIFERGKMVNIIKGCQTESTYGSILSGKEIGGITTIKAGKSKQVVVYTTPTCSWCTTLKTYLDQQEVRYREINVAADTSAAEAMFRKSGQQGVPQTEINGQMIVGFDKNRINQLLEIK